jgi:hypothetical protein
LHTDRIFDGIAMRLDPATLPGSSIRVTDGTGAVIATAQLI